MSDVLRPLLADAAHITILRDVGIFCKLFIQLSRAKFINICKYVVMEKALSE